MWSVYKICELGKKKDTAPRTMKVKKYPTQTDLPKSVTVVSE